MTGCSQTEDVLRVVCAGEFGIGSAGNPSGKLLTRTIEMWMDTHRDQPISQIELDFATVEYRWGDGPVSALVAILPHGVTTVRIFASSSNELPLKNLVEGSRMPWFEVVRIDDAGHGL